MVRSVFRAVNWAKAAIVLAAALVVQPAVLSGALAQPKHVTSTVTTPIAAGVPNPCTEPPDFVVLTGQTHVVAQATVDPSGGLDVVARSVTHVSGFGVPSGDRYQGMRKGEIRFTADSAGDVTVERSFSDRLRVQGPGNDLIVDGKLRITIDPTGRVIEAAVVDLEIRCQ